MRSRPLFSTPAPPTRLRFLFGLAVLPSLALIFGCGGGGGGSSAAGSITRYTIQDLGTASSAASRAAMIAHILGKSRTVPGDLGLGVGDLHNSCINASGQIVGTLNDLSHQSTDSQAYVYQNGSPTLLGTLGGAHSSAAAINDSGKIVGSASRADRHTLFSMITAR